MTTAMFKLIPLPVGEKDKCEHRGRGQANAMFAFDFIVLNYVNVNSRRLAV